MVDGIKGRDDPSSSRGSEGLRILQARLTLDSMHYKLN
jgi:hypothetical protein